MQEMWETQIWSLGQEDPLGGRHGNPPWYSCLENPMDREAWQAAVHANPFLHGFARIKHDWVNEPQTLLIEWRCAHFGDLSFLLLNDLKYQVSRLSLVQSVPRQFASWGQLLSLCSPWLHCWACGVLVPQSGITPKTWSLNHEPPGSPQGSLFKCFSD